MSLEAFGRRDGVPSFVPEFHTTLEESRPTTEKKRALHLHPGPNSTASNLAISGGHSELCVPSPKKVCSTHSKADSVASCRIMQSKLQGELLRDQQFEPPPGSSPSWVFQGAGGSARVQDSSLHPHLRPAAGKEKSVNSEKEMEAGEGMQCSPPKAQPPVLRQPYSCGRQVSCWRSQEET